MAMAMARLITRSLLTTATTKRSSGPAFRPSYTSLSLFNSRSPPVPTNFRLLHLRNLTAASLRILTPAHSIAVRAFATMQISSSLNDPIQWIIVMDEPEGNPTRSEIIESYFETLAAVVGSEEEAEQMIYKTSTRDYFAFAAFISKEHAHKIIDLPRVRLVEPDSVRGFGRWLISMHEPEGNPTRDEIIDSYVKILAKAVGSEEEARMKIFFVSTRHYFAFGAVISEEIAHKMLRLHPVDMVAPDSVVQTMYCGGEPFINGQAVPYDPKYHEEWLRNELRVGLVQLEKSESDEEDEEEEEIRLWEEECGLIT